MNEIVSAGGWILFVSVLIGLLLKRKYSFQHTDKLKKTADLIRHHFRPTSLEEVTISERSFPFRVRADLQLAIDALFDSESIVAYFCGVEKEYAHEGISFSECIVERDHNPVIAVPPQYEEVDIGEDVPVRCLKNGLWLLQQEKMKFVVLLGPHGRFGQTTGMQFQIATENSPEGTRIALEFFRHLEESVLKAASYRGKILSLEQAEHSYSGESSGIAVHKLRTVSREQVILPEQTIDLLDRNVIQFVQQRSRLSAYKQSTKKGILFYGPPGTGKTHTIHYLSDVLKDHTTLIITAEQAGLIGEYMTLARLLQPSVVVIEDVDLIARDRTEMGTCEEVMLNKLLNEMDGLKEDTDVLFLLTTNRPETLEAALASRPGRIDQAIEFPHPNDEGRAKLVKLYSQGVEISDDVVGDTVKRTEGVSASFIKELMRRSVQFHLERNGSGCIELTDVENALEEMLFTGGKLNQKLLGGDSVTDRAVGFH